MAFREEYGGAILSVQRSGEPIPNPGIGFRLEAKDRLMAFGKPGQVAEAPALVRGADTWEQFQ
jgi:K+/H+ antiporter YhaU regulatory subunit KhtT